MSHREVREFLHIGKCKIIQYYIDFATTDLFK
jgi:hypothetical protein